MHVRDLLVPAALLAPLVLGGCAASAQAKAKSSDDFAEAGGSSDSGGESTPPPSFKPNRKKPWLQPAGPIAGRWKTTALPPDMVIEITTHGTKATGRIVTLGEGGKRRYAQGEEILNLEVNDYGHWVGKLHWKSLSGGDRQEYIRFVASAEELDAIMTTDAAFKHMPRVK